MFRFTRTKPRFIQTRTRTHALSSSARPVNVAVVGATGAVGHELLQLLHSRNFPLSSLKLLASSRSAGQTIDFGGSSLVVESLSESSFDGIDIALFSAGSERSRQYAPAAVAAGAVVVDNSSAFRMEHSVPLVIPEVNPQALNEHQGIIANPNCSTIIMAVPVWALHKESRVRRIVVSTYQAASGAGAAAMRELEQQATDWARQDPLQTSIFGQQYLWNLFSHNTPIDPATGYNEEELKMVNETRKIFADNSIAVSATCVRVPTLRAHAMSINLSFELPMDYQNARQILANTAGVELMDDRTQNNFPTPLAASGQDPIMVGRIRADLSQAAGTGVELFAAGDQIRKGAALNAVQIAELLVKDDSLLLGKRPAGSDGSSSDGSSSGCSSSSCSSSGGSSSGAGRPVEVHKFGGAALGSAEAIRAVGMMLADQQQTGKSIAAVCSALFGVTNKLEEAVMFRSAGDSVALEATKLELGQLHRAAAEPLLPPAALDKYLQLVSRVLGHALRCDETTAGTAACKRSSDSVMHIGEVLSAELMAAHLSTSCGVRAECVSSGNIIRTDGVFGDATPDLTATKQLTQAIAQPILDAGTMVTIPGFFGASADGQVTTFGRGGSDLSATIVAHALNAQKVTLWKVETSKHHCGNEFGGWTQGLCGVVHCADLKRTIPHLSYKEASELARFGKKVLHHRTVQPVIDAQIPIAVRNLVEPSLKGSLISTQSAGRAGGATTITKCSFEHYESVRNADIALMHNFGSTASVVAVVGDEIAANRQLQDQVIRVLSRAFETAVVPAAVNQSPHSFCVILEQADAPAAVQMLHSLIFESEPRPASFRSHHSVQLRRPSEVVRMQQRCFRSR